MVPCSRVAPVKLADEELDDLLWGEDVEVFLLLGDVVPRSEHFLRGLDVDDPASRVLRVAELVGAHVALVGSLLDDECRGVERVGDVSVRVCGHVVCGDLLVGGLRVALPDEAVLADHLLGDRVGEDADLRALVLLPLDVDVREEHHLR